VSSGLKGRSTEYPSTGETRIPINPPQNPANAPTPRSFPSAAWGVSFSQNAFPEARSRNHHADIKKDSFFSLIDRKPSEKYLEKDW